MRTANFKSGFTLIETAATLAIISIVTIGLVSVSTNVLNRSQIEITNDNLNQLRRGVSGNPVIVINEARTSFGYLGDMGNLPANLSDLWVKGSQPAYTFNTTKKTGAGWNGPYLEVNAAEMASALGQDGWGNAFSYSTASFLDPTFGATALAKLVSLGPDFTLDTSDDIAINFFQSEVVSRVQGYVKDTNGNAVSGVGITLNYPQGGVLTSQVVYTDDTGYYVAVDVPFGNRSITIKPQLVLAPGTTIVSGNNNQNLKFTVKNYAANSLDVASLSLDYTIVPDAWFQTVKVGGTTVYNSTNPRFGQSDSVSFTAKTVSGTGIAAESVPIRLQSPVTDVADLSIGKVGRGGSLVVEFQGFYDVESGSGGNDVDVTGVNFQVTFRDSTNQVIGVVAVKP